MHILHLHSRRRVVLFALCCMPAAGMTQSFGAFKDTIYGDLKQEQSASFDRAVAQTLNDPTDNKILKWQGDARQKKSLVSGEIYANGSTSQNGLPCRNLHARLNDGSSHEDWTFRFCRGSDGLWKAVSQGLK